MRRLGLCFVATLAACSNELLPEAGPVDLGSADAGSDAGAPDTSGPSDTGALDAESNDADAGSSDSGGDAGAEDAGPSDGGAGQVVVHTTYLGLPAPSVIVFQSAAGDVLHTFNATAGVARADVPAGSMVTVQHQTILGAQILIRTIVGIEPGDAYDFELLNFGLQEGNVGAVDVRLPGAFAGASHYALDYGCGVTYATDATQIMSGIVPKRCASPTGRHVTTAATARGTAGAFLAYSITASTALVATGTTGITLDVWRSDFLDGALTVMNPPAGARSLSISRRLAVDDLLLLFNERIIDLVDEPTATRSFPLPPFGDGSLEMLRMTYAIPRFAVTVEPNPAPVMPRAYNLSTAMLQAIDAPVVTVVSATPARPQIEYHSPSGQTLDGVVIQLRVINPSLEWSITRADNDATFQLPALPDALAASRPTDISTYEAGVAGIDVDGVNNYAAYRRSVAALAAEQVHDLYAAPPARVRVTYADFEE